MNLSNESKLKGFLTRLLKKMDRGKPFTISFQDEKTHISQDKIYSIKVEKQGGFLLRLIGKVISFIKGGDGFASATQYDFQTKEGGLLPLAALFSFF